VLFAKQLRDLARRESGVGEDHFGPAWIRALDALITIRREQRKNAEKDPLGTSWLRAFFCHLVNGKSCAGWINVGSGDRRLLRLFDSSFRLHFAGLVSTALSVTSASTPTPRALAMRTIALSDGSTSRAFSI
jgi:hypothetical protein